MAPAGMHEQAESGGAAHAAYKGGLDAAQALRLQTWMQSLQALPLPGSTDSNAVPVEGQHRISQVAAAEQLFRYVSERLNTGNQDVCTGRCLCAVCIALACIRAVFWDTASLPSLPPLPPPPAVICEHMIDGTQRVAVRLTICRVLLNPCASIIDHAGIWT